MLGDTEMTTKLMIAAAGLAMLAGCAQTTDDGMAGDAPMATEARATLRGPGGAEMGFATISGSAGAMRLTVEGERLPQGAHGVHIHATGRCEGPAFETAGPHWNPANRQHGRDNPAGQHAGDLPNLIAGTDGRGSVSIDLPGVMLTGGQSALFDADGAALLIHAAADDYRTDPSGNSGGRIACGVFERR